MAFIGAKTPRHAQTFDLSSFELPEEELAWLAERLGSATPKTTALDALVEDLQSARSADPETAKQLRFARALKAAIIGGQRTLPGAVSVQKDGRSAADAASNVWNTLAKTPSGEPEAVARVRGGMENGLWGHEGELDNFCRWAKDHVSEARLTPAVLALVGEPGHGKDQALAAFTSLLGKKDARVLHVDFSGRGDRDIDAIFGEDAPLDIKALRKLAVEQKTIIRISGLDTLAQPAQKLVAALNQRLLARKGEPPFAALPYVLDFDQPATQSPRALVNAALGQAGNRVISAEARFARLDGETMARYASEVYLPRLLSARGLSGLTIRWEPDALAMLGEMLATPLAPLDEIEHRLLRFVLTHIDTQTFDRSSAVIGGRIAPAFEGDENKGARKAMQDAMHAPGADLFAAEQVFAMPIVGKRFDPAVREALLSDAGRLREVVDAAVVELLVALPEGDPELERLGDALGERLSAHRSLIEGTLQTIKRRERFNPSSLVRSAELDALTASAAQIEEALGLYTASAVEAISLMADGAQVLQPEVLDAQVRAAIAQITATFAALNANATVNHHRPMTLKGPSQALIGHTQFCTQAVVSPDGRVVASASGDGTVRLWDAATGAELGAPLKSVNGAAIYALAFSPDGEQLVFSGNDKIIHLWSVAARTEVTLSGAGAAMKALAFSPDGNMLVGGDEEGKLHFWDPSAPAQAPRTLAIHSAKVTALAFSPDGSTLTSGSADKTIQFLDVETLTQKAPPLTSHTQSVSALCYSPDGNVLASCSDTTVTLSDARSGAPLGAPLQGHTKKVSALAFAPSGRALVSGSEDQTMRMWELDTGKATALPTEHTSVIRSLAFSRDGTTLASSSNDKSVRLWRFGA